MTPLEQKLLNLLSNQDVTFFIPPYQRNYEWTDAQCKVFFEDVKKTCDNNMNGIEDEHFFGSITFFQDETNFGEPNKLVLIDGQQRITTTMLFLVAIRDTLHDDENICKFINSRYLKNDNATGNDDEYKVKLKQVETDWQSFKDLVLGNPLSDKAKMSTMYQNYKFFCNALKAYKENKNDIKALISYGIDKFSVVTIELKPKMNKWENPQEIFESMNSLGKPLSLADLVRNYLLLGLDANKQTELYNKYWLHIENILPEKISDFIRDYMQCLRRCSYPKSTEANYKELYSEFKNISKDTDADAEGILKNLSEYSTLYAYIVGNATSGNVKLDTILTDLRSIRITTAHSFILAYPELASEWSEDNADKPTEYLRTSPHTALWSCPTCHGEYETRICERSVGDDLCPYCSGKKLLLGFNDLASKDSLLASEWALSNPDSSSDYLRTSAHTALWSCPTCHGEYEARICDRTVGDDACPYCRHKKVLSGFNDLASVDSKLASEWSLANPDKPSEYLRTSPHKALWPCSTCHGEYEARICDRFVNDCICPYCNEKKVLPGFNSFAVKHPDEMEEWDELANYILADPDEILSDYAKKVWWNCPHGHKYDTSPKQKLYYRMRKMQPCPYCKGRRRKWHHFF